MLARLGDRNILFSEAGQAVYELNDLAAYVWRSLDIGMGATRIARELRDSGIARDQAERAVAGTVESLRRLGVDWGQTERAVEATRPTRPTMGAATMAPSPAFLAGSTERLTRLTIMIADVVVQLHVSKTLVADVEAVFGRLMTDVPDSHLLLCARSVGSTVDFCSPGQQDWSCDRSHFIPLLKAWLIERVLVHARYEVALHAAALARGNDAVLLVGSPGAGKTTLAIALAKAGFEVLADDVALLDGNGLVTGIRLPFTAKASSWSLLSRLWPGIASHPSHCRPDGQTLCYIPQDSPGDPRPRRISWVVLLNRHDDAPTKVDELDLACALTALVAEGATRDERLSRSGFTALVEGLSKARCCRLTYGDLKEAADAVGRLPS